MLPHRAEESHLNYSLFIILYSKNTPCVFARRSLYSILVNVSLARAENVEAQLLIRRVHSINKGCV